LRERIRAGPVLTSDRYALAGGFWPGEAGPRPTGGPVYLPVVLSGGWEMARPPPKRGNRRGGCDSALFPPGGASDRQQDGRAGKTLLKH